MTPDQWLGIGLVAIAVILALSEQKRGKRNEKQQTKKEQKHE